MKTRETGKSSSMNEKPREIQVTPDRLRSFPDPLWDKLDLENCRPLSAIEGCEGGYRFIILEMEHLRFGPLAGNGATANTTFFIVAIPESTSGRCVSWRPMDFDVSVDRDYAYLAKPGKQARPQEWRPRLQATIKVVESLTARNGKAGGFRGHARTYRPVGVGATIHALWAIIFLAFSLLLTGVGLGTMFGLIDYRKVCTSNSSIQSCHTTTSAYRVVDALKVGGGYLLGGGFMLIGALYYRERTRKRLPSKDDSS